MRKLLGLLCIMITLCLTVPAFSAEDTVAASSAPAVEVAVPAPAPVVPVVPTTVVSPVTPTVPSFGEIEEAVKSGNWVSILAFIFVFAWTMFKGTERLNQWRDTQVALAGAEQDIRAKARISITVKLTEIMRGVCAEVYEEYYRAIKQASADGKVTPEELAAAKKTARDMAVSKAIAYGKNEGIDLAKEFGIPFLKAAAEEGVSWLKAKAAPSA
jgi:hypothetical protein